MSNYKQKSKVKLENQNFDNSTYYGMSLEPVYVGGANEEKLNAFSTQVDLLKQKGFHDEANLLKLDADLYGIDQALYNLVLKADKQKQQRRVNENLQAIREGTGEVAKNILPVLSMMPGVDTFSDIGYTVADAVKGNWKGVGIGLGFIAAPGLGYGTYKGIKKLKNTNVYKNRLIAKTIKKEFDKEIKRQDRLVQQYGFHPGHTVPTGLFKGLPDPDPNTFYHSGNFTNFDIGPKSGGYVKIKDGSITPMRSYYPGSEDRIWWNKGDYYGKSSPVIITTKSSKVDKKVIDNLDKYNNYNGLYNSTYYSSGSIPIEEITIYKRNPFTGYYDSSIPYKSSESVVRANSNKLMDNPRFGKAHNKYFMNNDVDEVALFQQRLENGGWDKLGISEDMQIKYQGEQVNAREFLRNPQFIPMSSASYLPGSRFIIFNSKAPIRKLNMEKAHELFHAADHVYLETLGDAAKHGDDFISMGFPGVDYSQFDSPEKLYYFTRMGGTEMKSRFSQLKNYFGIKDANTPLTLKQWEFAKKHYPFNNHMTDFFKSVTNPKDFLNSMNKIVPIGAATIYGLSNITKGES